MFRQSDPYNKILNFYFDDTQAKPVQLSLPSRILHIRALCSGLFHVKKNLICVLDSLQRFDDSEWGLYEDKVAHELTAGTIILAGILDGLIMCYLFHNSPERSTSFCTTAFQRPDLQKIQQSINDLTSGSPLEVPHLEAGARALALRTSGLFPTFGNTTIHTYQDPVTSQYREFGILRLTLATAI